MRDFEDGLRFLEELMWILAGMAMVSPLWLYYLFVNGLHDYLIQTLGIYGDPTGLIKSSNILLVGLGMIIPLYEVVRALVDTVGAWERYVG